MTKTETKARLKKILEALDNISGDLYDLQYDVEDTVDSIEPYEGHDDLTPQQAERQEWFEELATAIEDLKDTIDTAYSDISSEFVD